MSRKITCFDANWKFMLGDYPDACLPDYNDAEWRELDLPHDWSIEGRFERSNPTGGSGGYLPAGIGWYRKHFKKPDGEVVLLEFDGVFQNCDVWLNGTHVTHHNYGYIGFECDLTPYLVEGNNVLAVRVDNSEQPNSRWYTGSGIYRHVWLTQASETRVAHWGIFVSTPYVSKELAHVKAQIELTKPADIVLAILDPSGKVLVEQTYSSKTSKFVGTMYLENPELWSCDNPVLYTLRTRVIKDGQLEDEVCTTFGVRSICFDKDKGFLLNGIQTKINGVCIHHDGGAVGAAVPEVVWERRLKLLKEMGCNAIRMSHNPPAPELLDMCDRMGFLVMDEAFDEWKIIKAKGDDQIARYGYGQFFEQDCEKDLLAMIRRDRNHPSIILWSIGNEIPEQSTSDGWKIAKRLKELCHKEDPTRPVTSACDNIKADKNRTTEEFLKTLDVVGFNYINRWRKYAETAYTDIRYEYPNMIIIGSEHGSVGGVRGDYSLEPEPGSWWSFPYNSRMIRAEHLLKQTMIYDYIAGDFMWTGIDYLGEARWPRKNAASGVIDMCGFPKDGYYLYQSIWTRKPMIHIFPHWNWKGKEGTVIPVLCYTNCDTVELIVNGRSFGTKCYEFPKQGMTERFGHYDLPILYATTNDLHLSWDVPYEPGVIKAIGRDRYGIVQAVKEIRTTGEPTGISLSFDRTTFTGRGEVAHCEIRVVDENGDTVPTAQNEITVAVKGAAELIGLDNGLPEDLTPMKSPVRKVWAGMALALIRATADQGEIVVTVSSPDLESTQAELHIYNK